MEPEFTNLAIDPDLLDRALVISGERTRDPAVTKALQEFIARREQRRILDVMCKLEWDRSFDSKAELIPSRLTHRFYGRNELDPQIED